MAIATAPDPATLLREQGLRVTSQRRAILAVVAAPGGEHLTAEQVHDRAAVELPELARATVYNTLNELVRAGLLRRIDGLGPALYDHDLAGEHHHFHCVGCGRLFDVLPTGADGVGLGGAGFEIARMEIKFEGRCPDCAAAVN